MPLKICTYIYPQNDKLRFCMHTITGSYKNEDSEDQREHLEIKIMRQKRLENKFPRKPNKKRWKMRAKFK